MFSSAFLAATILPLSSEVVLGVLLTRGSDPYVAIAVATLGNVLGSVVNYYLGFWGSTFILEKIFRVAPGEMTKARNQFSSWGTVCLLFAWVPGIGDPLTVAAGMLKIRIWIFLVLVTVGKLFRYIIVVLTVQAFYP